MYPLLPWRVRLMFGLAGFERYLKVKSSPRSPANSTRPDRGPCNRANCHPHLLQSRTRARDRPHQIPYDRAGHLDRDHHAAGDRPGSRLLVSWSRLKFEEEPTTRNPSPPDTTGSAIRCNTQLRLVCPRWISPGLSPSASTWPRHPGTRRRARRRLRAPVPHLLEGGSALLGREE
jgi:hypothetical protein